jgi:site-specific DNA-methyltransferase (adenine-specific)
VAEAWTLNLGDCLAEGGLATLADRSVDHVICDPPYEAEAHTQGRRGRRGGTFKETPLSFAAITQDERRWAAMEFRRISRRWVVIFCQIEAVDAWRAAIGHDAYVRTMVWIKDTTTPQMTGDRPGMGWESILVAHAPGAKRWNAGGRCGVWRGPSVVQMGTPNEHETQKPLSLMEDLLRAFTDPDDLVCDPFAGSGTTGVACIRLGRRFIGWEKDPSYYETARKRLGAARQQYELLPRGPKPRQSKLSLSDPEEAA